MPFYLLFLLVSVYSSTLTTINITPTSFYISTSTTYTINIQTLTTIPSGGSISITFPAMFTTLPSGSLTCTSSQSAACTCSLIPNTLTITSCFPLSPSTFKLTLYSVPNPSYAKTSTAFQLYTYSNTNSLLDVQTSGPTITFLAYTLAFATITAPYKVADYSTWTLALNTAYSIPAGGYVYLNFPLWSSSLGSGSSLSYCSGTQTCKETLSLLTSLSCSCSSNVLSVVIPSGFKGSLNIEITSLQNPPTTTAQTGFTVNTGYLDGFIEKSAGISVSVGTPASISVSGFSLSGSTEISSTANYYFQFSTGTAIAQYSAITLTFPSAFGTAAVSGVLAIFGLSAITYTVSSSSLVISGGFSTGYLIGNQIIAFEIYSVTNPSTTQPSSSISISITDQYSGSIALVNSGLTVTSTPGTLSGVVVSPLVLTIGFTTLYSFTFTLQHGVSAGACIHIQFPVEILAGNTAGNCFYLPAGTALAAGAQCSISDSQNLWITSGFPTGNLTSTVKLQINNVKNPTFPSITSNFTISTYPDSTFSYWIDTYLGSGLSYTAGTLSSVSILPASSTTGDSTTYTFAITPTNPIPLKGYIEIALPPEITASQVSCSNAVGFNAPLVCYLSSSTVNITQGFEASALASGTLSVSVSTLRNPASTRPSSYFAICTKSLSLSIDCLSNVAVTMTTAHLMASASISVSDTAVAGQGIVTVSFSPFNAEIITQILVVPPSEVTIVGPVCGIVAGFSTITCGSSSGGVFVNPVYSGTLATAGFTISGVTLPGSTKPSSTFSIYTSNNAFLIDYWSTGLVIAATQPGQFESLLVSVADSGINQVTSYAFTFKNSHTLPAAGYLEIVFPSQISFTSTVACTYLSITSPCTLLPSTILFYPNTPLVPSIFELAVSGLKNYYSASTSSAFSVTSRTTDGYSIDVHSTLTVSFTCHSPCTSCTTTADTCTSCTGLYLWNDTCNSACEIGYYSVPSYLCSACSSECYECTGEATYCTSCTSGVYLYKNTCLVDCPEMYWGNQGTCVSCGTYCETCGVNGCEKCSQGFLYNGGCVDVCAGVVILDTCYDCEEGCSSCSVSATNCTACSGGYLMYSNTCYETCPNGTAQNGTEDYCEDCSNGCALCSSPSACTQCKQSYYLSSGSCSTTCPEGTYQSNATCLSCRSPCKTCSMQNCTSCADSYYLYQDNCLASCPLLTTVPYQSTCIPCSPTCLTCAGLSTSCSSCCQNYYLYKASCVLACPSATVGIDSVCYACADNCEQCQGNADFCTMCSKDYVLYGNNCVSACPANSTVSVNGTCQACASECLGCEGSTSYCTSCVNGSAYLGECLSACPSGYYAYKGECVGLCSPGCTEALLQNGVCDQVCNSAACAFDNNTCTLANYSESLAVSQAPFPSATAGAASVCLSGASKYFVPSSNFVGSSVSMLSVAETGSWVSLAYQLNNLQYLHGRALLEDSEKILLAFSLILGFLALHFMENLVFALVYYYQVLQKDIGLHLWTKKHRCSSAVVLACSCLISFKIIRTLITNFFGMGFCTADLAKKSALYRPLLTMTYLSIATTSVPIICLLTYILSTYSTGNLIFMLALDSLITTAVVTLLSIPDIIYMHNQISLEKDRIYLPQFLGGNETDNIGVETFQVFENGTNKFDTESGIEKTLLDTNRSLIFPERTKLKLNLDLDPVTPSSKHEDFLIEEPVTPTNLFQLQVFSKEIPGSVKPKTLLVEESMVPISLFQSRPKELPPPSSLNFVEFLVEEPQAATSSFNPELFRREVPHPHSAPIQESVKIDSVEYLQVSTKQPEFISVVIDSPSVSNESVAAPRPFEFEILDSSKEYIDEENEPQLLDTILEESELNISSADIDMFDPECIQVHHKLSGLKVLLKKGFNAAELEDGERLNASNYSIYEIDPSDLHYAILRRSNSDSYIRARRNFAGATVVDVELRSGMWLVGRTVRREEDFDFENAYVGYEPESVVAVHRVTGVRFSIRKSFVGAVNNDGELLEEYDESVVVDNSNVRCGFIYGDIYKRSFVGGLITALLDQEQQRPSVQDNTAFFIRDSEIEYSRGDEELGSIKFNQDEFSNTFSEGFFFTKKESSKEIAMQPLVSIEMQTDEAPVNVVSKIGSCLSLTVLDSISVGPTRLNVAAQDEFITYDEPVTHSVKKAFMRFENIEEETGSYRSRSSTARGNKETKKIVKKVKKGKKNNGKGSSRSSSKVSTPRNSSLRRGMNSGSLKSEESMKSIEAIYLQRLRTPKDTTPKMRSIHNVHAAESYSDLSMSLQMSLTRLNMISAPSQHNFELIRKDDK